MGANFLEESDESSGARRRALLICNGRFPLAEELNLDGVAQDAEKIRDVLAHPNLCGFEVRSAIDEGLVHVRREVAKICGESADDDALLIYYSGQGMLDDESRLHLLVADSQPGYWAATALEPNFILSQLRKAGCSNVILIVDTCHAGAFFKDNQGIPDALYAITSCAADELAFDTQEGGAFSVALTNGLQGAAADADGDGRVTIDELHSYIKRSLAVSGQAPQKWEWNVREPIYMTTYQRPVFLSYSRKDTEAASALKSLLEAGGFNVWMDTDDIRSGAWKERIFEGLDKARAMIFLTTSDSLNSKWVRKEIDLAAHKNVPVIPLQIGDPDIPDWFMFEYGELHKYWFDPERSEDIVETMAAAIRDASLRSKG